MTKKKNILLGAHMSIAGGFHKAIERGVEIGCTAIQIFTKSNRQWYAKKITSAEIETFKKAWKISTIKSVVAHASYLINIGSPKKETAEKSLKALIQEIKRCHELGIPSLVLHPGARLDSPREECLLRIADNLNEALHQTPNSSVTIALETMAGQGSTVCDTFEDIAHIISHIKNKKRIGVTFDTCHTFAAGYDISTKAGCKKVFDEFDTTISLKYLKIIHLNDSKRPLDDHVDRHAEIGKGKIGLACFSYIMHCTALNDIPKILETPEPSNYEHEIELLRNI